MSITFSYLNNRCHAEEVDEIPDGAEYIGLTYTRDGEFKVYKKSSSRIFSQFDYVAIKVVDKPRKEVLKQKLFEYGFPTFDISMLMQGRWVNVPYGQVKVNRKTHVLTTKYEDGRIKTKQL